MKLIDYYRQDLKGLTSKEAKAMRALWHSSVRRCLHLLQLTSDPVPPFPTRRAEILDPNDFSEKRAVIGTYVVTMLPRLSFFLNRDYSELVAVFRASKPPKPVKPK